MMSFTSLIGKQDLSGKNLNGKNMISTHLAFQMNKCDAKTALSQSFTYRKRSLFDDTRLVAFC